MNICTKHYDTYVAGNITEKGLKDLKSQRIREFTMRLYFQVTSEETPIKSHGYD